MIKKITQKDSGLSYNAITKTTTRPAVTVSPESSKVKTNTKSTGLAADSGYTEEKKAVSQQENRKTLGSIFSTVGGVLSKAKVSSKAEDSGYAAQQEKKKEQAKQEYIASTQKLISSMESGSRIPAQSKSTAGMKIAEDMLGMTTGRQKTHLEEESAGLVRDSWEKRTSQYLSDAQRKTLQRFAEAGDYAAVKEYYDAISSELNAKYTEAQMAQEKRNTKNSKASAFTNAGSKAVESGNAEVKSGSGFVSTALESTKTGLMNAVAGIPAYIDALASEVVFQTTGKYRPTDVNGEAYLSANLTRAAQEGLSEKIDVQVDPDRYKALNQLAHMASNGWSSAVTNMTQVLLTGGYSGGGKLAEQGTLAMMGTSVAGQEYTQRVQEGEDEGRALTNATVAGLLEYLTETIPMHNYLDAVAQASAGKMTRQAFIKYFASQAGAESAEEVVNNVAGNLWDMWYNGDDSDFHKLVEEYRKNGVTDENEAKAQAYYKLFLLDSLEAAATAAISTVFMNAVPAHSTFKSVSAQGADLKAQGAEEIQLYIEGALATADPKSEVYQLASKAQEKLNAGRELTNLEAGNLAVAMEQHVWSEIQKADTERENDIVSAYTTAKEGSTSLSTAKARSAIFTRLAYGEKVTDAEIESLNLNSPVTRQIYEKYTGQTLSQEKTAALQQMQSFGAAMQQRDITLQEEDAEIEQANAELDAKDAEAAAIAETLAAQSPTGEVTAEEVLDYQAFQESYLRQKPDAQPGEIGIAFQEYLSSTNLYEVGGQVMTRDQFISAQVENGVDAAEAAEQFDEKVATGAAVPVNHTTGEASGNGTEQEAGSGPALDVPGRELPGGIAAAESRSAEGDRRDVGEGAVDAGEPDAGVSGREGAVPADQRADGERFESDAGEAAQRGQSGREEVKAESATTKSLGIPGGAENPVTVLEQPKLSYAPQVEQRAAQLGFTVRWFEGDDLRTDSGVSGDGVVDFQTKTIYVRADSTGHSARSIAEHELGHVLFQTRPAKIGQARGILYEVLDSRDADILGDVYYARLGGIYRKAGMPEDAVRQATDEELFCDLFAGYDRFDSLGDLCSRHSEVFSEQLNREESAAPDGEETEQPSVRWSETKNPYTYDALIQKPDMKVTLVRDFEPPTKGKKFNIPTIAKMGLEGADTIQGERGVQRYVYVQDLGANVGVNPTGTSHGIVGNKTSSSSRSTAEVTPDLMNILRNSIVVNELGARNEKDGIGGYILLGYGEKENGDGYVVKTTVNRFAENRSSVDDISIYHILKGSKAKKVEGRLWGSHTAEAAASIPMNATFTISVADFLDLVKTTYPNLLPTEVLAHYGIDDTVREEGLKWSATENPEQKTERQMQRQAEREQAAAQKAVEAKPDSVENVLAHMQTLLDTEQARQEMKAAFEAFQPVRPKINEEVTVPLQIRDKEIREKVAAAQKRFKYDAMIVRREERLREQKTEASTRRIEAQERAKEQKAAQKSELRRQAAESARTAKRRADFQRAEAELASAMNAGAHVAKDVTRANAKIEEIKQKAAEQKKLLSLRARQAKSTASYYQRAAEEDPNNDVVDTLRKLPGEEETLQARDKLLPKLRAKVGAPLYRAFVNQVQAIDTLSKRQTGVKAGSLINMIHSSSSTSETIFQTALVGRDGHVIGAAMKDVMLMWEGQGKRRKVDTERQALLQDYLLHRHNIDRMGIKAKARREVQAFEEKNPWLRELTPNDLALLVAEGQASWTERNDIAVQYKKLMDAYLAAKNKPIFADSKGRPVTATTSEAIVAAYEQKYNWLAPKASEIYDWWDSFMMEWAVGDTVSADAYELMRDMYPSYVPTYRVGKGVGAAASANGTISPGQAVKKAVGSTKEVEAIEESFASLVNKIVRLERANELLTNLIDTAMEDSDGVFAKEVQFDWEGYYDGNGAYGESMITGAWLNGSSAAELEDSAAREALSKEGKYYKISGWYNGEKLSAYVNEDIYKALESVVGSKKDKLDKLTKWGNTFTGPMKTMITGINPFFAVRNVARDLPTALINSTAGFSFVKYYAQAWQEIAKNSEHWKQFQALGGTNNGYYSQSKTFSQQMQAKKGAMEKVTEKLGVVNELTESATRFAEYLATIARQGDTYEARIQGIKNAAEVTVDFSRKGTYGGFLNAWVPYWNPAVQGIDKVLRSVVANDEGVKGAMKTATRGMLLAALPEAFLYVILKSMGRWDDWEELSDRTKHTYYCIPVGEHSFIKIAKNREWAAVLGTPLMALLEKVNGREDPLENYLVDTLAVNFLPGGIEDAFGIGTFLELQTNKDFAGRTIIPSQYQGVDKSAQWDSETSMLAMALSRAMFSALSPMQLDYILHDYFGDFISTLALDIPNMGWTNGDFTFDDVGALAADFATGSFVADNRYSSQTINDYYAVLDDLEQEYKTQALTDQDYQNGQAYQMYQAISSGWGKDISALYKERNALSDGPEKDAVQMEIVGLAQAALAFYKEATESGNQNPLLTVKYMDFDKRVSDELIRLDKYTQGDNSYSFKPSTYKPTSITQDDRRYTLDDAAVSQYEIFYRQEYNEIFSRLILTPQYRNAGDEAKAEMLEAARDEVLAAAKADTVDWMRSKGYASVPK